MQVLNFLRQKIWDASLADATLHIGETEQEHGEDEAARKNAQRHWKQLS
jgi:hypothetical protein